VIANKKKDLTLNLAEDQVHLGKISEEELIDMMHDMQYNKGTKDGSIPDGLAGSGNGQQSP
jgi:hypothetical protein